MEIKPKLIADIRCYASQDLTVFGDVEHHSFSSLYEVPHKHFMSIGERFACKLRELGFKLPGFDHLCIHATPALAPSKCVLSEVTDNRTRHVDVGLRPDEWNVLPTDSKHDFIVDLLAQALQIVSDGVQHELLFDVSNQLKTLRSDIEIKLKSKETKKYIATVAFKIHPSHETSVANLSYTDKTTGTTYRKKLCDLELADDIYKLCGSISVKNGVIIVAPRSSFLAGIAAGRYATPFRISISDMLREPLG